jgi:hypothetical protein
LAPLVQIILVFLNAAIFKFYFSEKSMFSLKEIGEYSGISISGNGILQSN